MAKNNEFQVIDATREKTKIRISVDGVSGAGKTVSSLMLAYGLAGNDWSKVGFIDSEQGHGLMYANRTDLGIGSFKYINLAPPYTVERYRAAMRAMEEVVGTDGVIVVDSISPAWKGEGGVLDAKETIARQNNKTDFSAWNDAGKLQQQLINEILGLSCHCIVTMRSKQKYSQETDPETGKSRIVKQGLEPIQQGDFEYEMELAFTIDKDTHKASISKDNTFLETEGFYDVITPEVGQKLKAWLDNGVEPEIFTCECCGNKVHSETVNGTLMKPKDIAESSKKKYKQVLCLECAIKKNEEMKRKQAEGNK